MNTKSLFIIFVVLLGLIMGSLYMHSPLELREEGVRYINFIENKDSFSRDILNYAPSWYDNPARMYHNFHRMVYVINKYISADYSFPIVFIMTSLIFLVSCYLIGYELSKHYYLALVPCFIYFFGFIFPDMQSQFHDHELNQKHFAVALVAFSLWLYMRKRKLISYLVAVAVFLMHVKLGFTWGCIIILLTLKDFFTEKKERKILFSRVIITGIFLIPIILLNLKAYSLYDFSGLPEWLQYELKINCPGGRSIVNIVTLYGWNKAMAGIFGSLNGILILAYFWKRKHIKTLSIVFIGSLLLGIAWGSIHDFYGFTFISKIYPLVIFSFVSLANFFLLSLLFIECLENRKELINSFTCFYMILFIPFFRDGFIQLMFTMLLLIRTKTFGQMKIFQRLNKDFIAGMVSIFIFIYVCLIKEPHYIGRWAEIAYVTAFLLIPFILHWLNLIRSEVNEKYYIPIFLSIIIGLVVLSSIYGHSRESGRFKHLFYEYDICKYIEKNTKKDAFILYYSYFDWLESKRLAVRMPFNSRLVQYDSSKIFPELVKRSKIMFEEGSFEKYFKLRLQGKRDDAQRYLDSFWKKLSKDKLYEIKKHYPIDYLIREKDKPIENLNIFYQNKKYFVYNLN